MTTDMHWRLRSACTPDDAWMFDYDPNRKAPERHVVHSAKALCHSCPVLDVCALDAIDVESGASAKNRYEIVGGLTPVERAALDPKAGKRTSGRSVEVQVKQPPRSKCGRGHDMTPENTQKRSDRPNNRECKTCVRENKRRYEQTGRKPA